MKISNFELVKVSGSSVLDWKFDATIDVTSGFLFNKTQ